MPCEELHLEQSISPRSHRHCFSRLGLGLTVYLSVNYILVLAANTLFYMLETQGVLSYDQTINSVLYWVVTYILPTAAGLLACYLIIRRVPALVAEKRQPLPPIPFFKAYFTAVMCMYLLAYLTELLMTLVGSLRGDLIENPVQYLDNLPLFIKILLPCIVAPVVEELTYRRLLIPRLQPYGDRFAIAATALCFGLMHGNLNQFFYAVVLGAVLGYVYVKSGCIWQTMLLHALINFMGSVAPTLAEACGDLGAGLYVCLILCHIGVGVFCLLYRRKPPVFAPGVYPLRTGEKWRLFLLNFGMICFCLICLAQCVMYLLA